MFQTMPVPKLNVGQLQYNYYLTLLKPSDPGSKWWLTGSAPVMERFPFIGIEDLCYSSASVVPFNPC